MKMNELECSQYCGQLNLPFAGVTYLKDARSSEPSRSVQSRVGNVVTRFPSRKMGCVIATESRTAELALVYQLEHDDEVREFYDQPPAIKLSYENARGKRVGGRHTPDFLVLRDTSVEFVECKPEAQLEELSASGDGRFRRNEAGDWICPPGIEAAQVYGFNYVVRTDSDYNPTLITNLRFLADYSVEKCGPVGEEERRILVQLVSEHPGILVAEVEDSDKRISIDMVFQALAQDVIFADLNEGLLTDPLNVELFASRSASQAHNILRRDGQVPAPSVEDPKLQQNAPAYELMRAASPEDQVCALFRRKKLFPPEGSPPSDTPERTLARWRRDYKNAKIAYGCGLVGLLPKRSSSGNRTPRLPIAVYDVFDVSFEEDYATAIQRNKKQAYGLFCVRCEKAGYEAPSLAWYSARIDKQPPEAVTLRRKGRRAAYQEQGPVPAPGRLPHRGMFPFDVVEIDHTQIDLEVVDSQTGGNLGRPWLTIMIDQCSRRILAFHLSFAPPAYTSCMMVIRSCVERFERLPKTLSIDNGAEFHSTSFETLAATFEIELRFRPPARARFGAIVERAFGTVNSLFLHNLTGNTQITKNVRQVTKSFNPREKAIWTLERVHSHLEAFCHEIYDQREHPKLHLSPRDAFEAGLLSSGERTSRRVCYDSLFRIMVLPASPRGTGKVHPSKGITLNHLHYWCEAMREPAVHRKPVPVRVDPANAGVIFAFINGLWQECRSSHYAVFGNRTVKEVQIATELFKQRNRTRGRRLSFSDRQLAEFLKEAGEEESLMRQRRKDVAQREIVSSVIGEAPTPPTQPDGRPAEDNGIPPTKMNVNDLEEYDDYE